MPIASEKEFISIWVRILREDIPMEDADENFQPQRVLVCIWPIFEICNMLNCSIGVTESTTKEKTDILGKGDKWALSTPTTHNSAHFISFKYP